MDQLTPREREMLHALAAMAWQWLTNREELVFHDFISAGELTVQALERNGLIVPAETGGWNWTEEGREFALKRG